MAILSWSFYMIIITLYDHKINIFMPIKTGIYAHKIEMGKIIGNYPECFSKLSITN